jgi:fructokinase
MPVPTIVVAGEVLVDLVSGGDGCFQAHPGGGPANAAVALARLGVDCAFLGRLSRDAFGTQLSEWLSGNGVDLSMAVRCDEPTTLAVATLQPSGSAAYSFYWQGTSNWAWTELEFPGELPPGVQALHIGSLATVVEPAAQYVDRLVRASAGAVTTFVDPNFRPPMDRPDAARTRLDEWVRICDIVKVSVDDLVYAYADDEPFDVAERWAAGNDTVVLVTDGALGAHAFFCSEHLHAPATVSQVVVDTIGAGDSFGAGFLYGLHVQGALLRGAGWSAPQLQQALETAVVASGMTCERAGICRPRCGRTRWTLAPRSVRNGYLPASLVLSASDGPPRGSLLPLPRRAS